MALSLERYRQLKADNKIGWNTEALESTGKNIKSFIDGVNGQRQMSGAQWTADEFGKQRQQLDSLRGQLRYMQSYADSLKGTDAARYGKLNESIKSMGAALDESENWFAQNRDEEKRNNDYKTKKTGDALRELVQGGTDAAQAAEKYGLDKDELEKDYKDIRAYQKQGLREDKYGSMGFDDLTGVLRSSDSMGQRIYDEIRRDYGDGLRNAQDFDRNAVFKSRAEKYGLTQDEVKRIYETFENNEGDKHYQSTALSDEDKAYVARRIIETGSVEELQELKKTLPKAQYFDSLRYQLNQAIEDKSEQRYYLDIAEQNPRVTKIMEDIAAIDKELPSLANDTGARTGHKGQFDNITDAQAARASYMRELTAQGYDAEKMVRYYKRYKERTENEQNQQALREWTQQNPVTAALGSVASVPVNMVGSVGDVVKVAMARLEELAGGDGWYDPKGTANYTAQNIRGSVNEMIGDENHIGQLLYSTGMSMGDMVLAAAVNAVPVVGQAASNAMFFSSAGVGAANEVIQNGGDINQATAAMIAQGSAELIFERISLDKLESFANGAPVKDAKSYFKNVLKQAFVEGSEEFNTTLANTLTDALINGGNSAVEREIRQYTEQGMSRDEAKTKAWETWLRGVVDDAVGGALSGGVLGGFAGAKNISDYIDLQQSLGGLAVTPEQMSALLGEDKAASADAAAALVKENGVDAVLEAVKQNGEKQTRQTAEHFADLRKKGKLDEKDAAALLVKLAREQADTEMTDALARVAGAETKTDYKARTAQAESYNSDYDLSGARIEDGKTQLDSSFGVSHPHGMAARGLNREQMTVLGVESSLEEYGRDDRTVTLRLSDGSVTDAAGVTLADFDFDRLLNLASGYDTIGARALLSNYETAKANGASLDAYQAAFDALYQAGADGVRFEKAAENPQLRTLSDMIGEQAARAAVEAGNADGEIMVQARQTLVRRVRVPGKKHLGQSRIGVEYGAKDVSDDTKALLNAFAEKIGKQIIFTDRLNADENGLYSGNVIYLNSNLEEHAIFSAALHEAMHNARVYDPEGFRHVQAFVVNYLTAEGKDTDALLGDIAARWGKDAATREVQMEELVCKTVEALAADSEALQRAIENKKNSGILKKVGDALRRIADRIMQYFKGDREQGQRGHNKQAQAFLDDAAALRQMAELCSEAFENARENEREFGGKESEERYSIGMNEPYNQYSLKRIERFIAEGAKYKDLSMREFIDKTEEYGYGALPFLSIGREHPDFKPEIKTYYRIGEPRLSPDGTYKSSYNYADDKPEEGISVVTSEWLHSMKSVFFGVSNEDLKRRGVYKITGFELPSKGGDNEKLIIPMDWAVKTRITTKRGLEKAVADAEKDNAGAAVPKNPNGRYSKDDTIFDDFEDEEWLWQSDESGAAVDTDDPLGLMDEPETGSSAPTENAFDKLVTENPDEAVYVAFNAAAKTVERTLRSFAGVNPQQADLERVARKVMRQYGIKEKYNPELVGELAADMKAFSDDVRTKKKGDFSTFLNALAVKCRGYLEHSGDYTRGEYEEVAKNIFGYLRGATLIVTPYAQSHVLDSYDGSLQALRRAFKGYVNVGLEKDKGKYKRPIYMDDVIDEISNMTTDGTTLGEISWLFPDGERPDSLSGWAWLQNLLRNTLQPSFVNSYHEGYRESIDSAALEMAFDMATEIAAAKSEKTAKAKNVSEQRVRELEALLKSNNISDRQMRELEELREAKKLSDKQVRKMEELHKEAIEQQKAIHKAKQEQLNRTLRREQWRYQQEHKKRTLAEEEVAVLKQTAANRVKSYREQYEQRAKTRNDLEAVRRQMAKLRTMVVNPTNKKFIPVEILHNKAFMDAVESIGENVLLNRRKDIAQKMDELVKEIRQMRGNGDEDFDDAFDAEYTAELQGFVDWIKDDVQQEQADGTKAYKRQGLDAYEIGQLRRVVDELMHRIENARKLLLREDGMLAQEASEAVIRETRAMDTGRAKKLFSGFAQQMMNPLRTVNFLSGYNENSELHKLFYALNEGQRKSLFWQMNAEKLFGSVVERYEDDYKKACNDVVHFDYTADGKGYKVDMTRMQALQVLMTWKRESKSPMNHMKRGGIVVADPKAVAKGNGKAWENARTVPVSYDLINQIIHAMGKFENEYMLTAEHYFNEVSKKAINETFMVTRHREIARSDYYIPVRVDSDYTKSEIQSLKFDFTIEGAGSYKHITPHAPQPILIESLNSVIDRHIAQTGKLYGLDVPLINFKRMFKGTTRFSNEGSAWFEADSVKKALGEKFGKDTVKFIEQVVTDLEAGREEKTDKFSKVAEFLYRNRVRTSLVGNLGVVIKQAASYPTAGLYLSAGDLNKGLAAFAKKGLTKHYGDIIKEIDQHTAQHYIRRKGMSVQEVSDMFRQSKLARKAPTVINPVKWIQGMDCLTTAALWEATKSHVDGQYKKSGAATGTEAYWQEVTALYDTVIEDTQPMYDVLHRSEFQKNKSSVRKFLFPFKTQPMQNMGILANAAAELTMKKDKASRRKFAKAVASQVTSNLVFSLMTFAAAWMRHRDDRYKDENDELTFSSIMGGVFWDMFTNGVNTIAPIGGEYALSLGEDFVTNVQNGKTPWSSFSKTAEATEISVVNDWFDKFSRAAKLLENQLNGTNKKGIDPWDFTFRVLDVPGSFAEIFGIPYSNLSTIFKGVGNRIKDTQMYGLVNNKGELKTDHITGHILNAYHSGNRKKGGELTRMWAEQKMSEGYTAEKAQSYVQKKLLEGIAATEEAQQAAQAELDGDYATAERLEQALTAQGLSEELVHKAVEKNLNALNESQSTPKAPKSGGRYQLSDAFKAVVGGDEESLAVVKKDLLENGKTEEDIEKYLKSFSQTKELFEDYYANSGERFHRARKILERIYGDELAAKYADFKKRYKDGR